MVDATMFWSPEGGGVRRYLTEKRAWFERQPHCRQTLVTPGRWRCDSPFVPGLPLPFSRGYRFVPTPSRASRVLVGLQPDLIEAGDPYQLAWAALRAGRRLGIPVTAFFHSDLIGLAAQLAGTVGQQVGAAYARRLYRCFDLVFAPSRHAARILGDLGVQNVVEQPLGVDTNRFHPKQRDPTWRAQWGLSSSTRVLLYAGRYAPEKNLDLLAAATRRLGPNHVLVTIGSGPCPPSGGAVLRLPYESRREVLVRAMASADVFVHAGTQETFGLAVLEALACGVPVAVCAQGALAELVDSEVGEVAQHCTANALTEAIAAVLQRDRAVLGQQARRRALVYDWNRVFMRLQNHYRRLAGLPRYDAMAAT